MDLRALLAGLPADRGQAGEGKEYVRGWGVFALPFASGDVLALRVFPQNDFSPYVAVWHRDPLGRWAIYVDGARLDTACPRYFGPVCDRTALTKIDVAWIARNSLRVQMNEPLLDWTLEAHATPLRMYFVDDAAARLGGVDLGRPVRLPASPLIGEFRLPSRGVLVKGGAVWDILDPGEYARTRAETASDPDEDESHDR